MRNTMLKLMAIAAAGCMATPALAGVTYTFTSTDGHVSGGYQLTRSGFFGANTDVATADFTSCSGSDLFGDSSCFPVQTFLTDPSGVSDQGSTLDAISFALSTSGGNVVNYLFYFADGALSTPGLYTSVIGNSGTLSVSSATEALAAPVPGPAGWTMMIGGIGMIGYAMRRRNNASTKVAFAHA